MPDFLYALNASTVQTTSILGQIRAAGGAGYAGIELWFDAVDAHVKHGGSLKDIRLSLADEGLAVPTMIYLGGWFDAPSDQYAGVMDECKRRMGIAAEPGAHYVIAGPPIGKADYQIGARRYRELSEIGSALGVRPAMEFLGFVDELNTIEEALAVMTRSGRDDATTVLDPAHIYRGGGSVESIAKLRADQIAICHFDDCPADVLRERQSDEDRVMPGSGVFDLMRYLSLLREIGYRRFLSLELFRNDLWRLAPEDVARAGLESMRQVVEG
ncbi:MAG: sugar phosphate isomerase/epimerase [Pirellulales bacterium]|nr:sugar phosphate isomerase/epimerase [Pirellulales bacterium]